MVEHQDHALVSLWEGRDGERDFTKAINIITQKSHKIFLTGIHSITAITFSIIDQISNIKHQQRVYLSVDAFWLE